MSYPHAFQEAMDRQGITAIVDALADADITADVWQTGGFILVASVWAASGELYVVTDDGHYVLGRYKDEDGFYGGEGTYVQLDTLPEVVAALRPVV